MMSSSTSEMPADIEVAAAREIMHEITGRLRWVEAQAAVFNYP